MSLSRRGFFGIVGAAGTPPPQGAFLSARGLEAHYAEQQQAGQGRGGGQGRAGGGGRPAPPPGVEEIKINSNENPLGPGKAALDAILGKFPEAGRYPFNSSPNDGDLVDTIAKKYMTKPENVVLGAGSQEILKTRDARVRVAVPAPGDRGADVRELHGHRAADTSCR